MEGVVRTALEAQAEGTQAFLFDENSPNTYSPVFNVPFGGGVLLRAFGLGTMTRVGKRPAKKQHATVHMVRDNIQRMPHSDGGCGDNQLVWTDFEIVHEECVKQCGMWSLYDKQNVAVLSVPGQYRLKLNDDAAVGQVTIEVIRLSSSTLRRIPTDMFFGKLS